MLKISIKPEHGMTEHYIKYEYWIAVWQLVFAMLGMGVTLNEKDFREVVLEPVAINERVYLDRMP